MTDKTMEKALHWWGKLKAKDYPNLAYSKTNAIYRLIHEGAGSSQSTAFYDDDEMPPQWESINESIRKLDTRERLAITLRYAHPDVHQPWVGMRISKRSFDRSLNRAKKRLGKS